MSAGADRHVVGVDLGGTKVRAGLFDSFNNMLGYAVENTMGDGTPIVDQISRLAGALCKQHEVSRGSVRLAVIGVPAVVSPRTGVLGRASNLPGLDGTVIAEQLQGRLGMPILAENDVNLAALGEATFGVAQGARDFVFLAVGTGVGLGVYANGALLRGSSGAAGEISMFPAFGYERAGLPLTAFELEPLAGGKGIIQRYIKECERRGRDTRQLKVSVPEIVALAEGGDECAVLTMTVEADLLARALLCVVGVLDPELVVLGGGIGRTPMLAAEILRVLEPALPSPLRFEVTSLGDRCGVLGAAVMANTHSGEFVQGS
jgi:predicted NBD/HSP70 family sugar kinase